MEKRVLEVRYLGLGLSRENLSIKIITGGGVVRGSLGKFLREQFPSQIILKRFEETFRKREKVFQVSENTAKIRDEFSGCYKPSPLKKNLVPRFGD